MSEAFPVTGSGSRVTRPPRTSDHSLSLPLTLYDFGGELIIIWQRVVEVRDYGVRVTQLFKEGDPIQHQPFTQRVTENFTRIPAEGLFTRCYLSSCWLVKVDEISDLDKLLKAASIICASTYN